MPQCGRGPGAVQLEHDAAPSGRQPRAEPSVVGPANFTFGQPRPVVSGASQVRPALCRVSPVYPGLYRFIPAPTGPFQLVPPALIYLLLALKLPAVFGFAPVSTGRCRCLPVSTVASQYCMAASLPTAHAQIQFMRVPCMDCSG